jgi:cytochrome oxidase Cu insertion factor (SCO1/SenC/PrrC family)
MPTRWLVWSAALVVGIAGGIGIAAASQNSTQASPTIPTVAQPANPRLDRGTALSAVAPAFTLTDQFGKKTSLSSFRGKVVVLSFNDPECTTICPLTTTALLEAKKLLGPAAANVQLLGLNANPSVTDVKAVRAYSQTHGLLRKWLFLTGSLPEMKRVWTDYGILAAVVHGTVDHTPATYVIDPQGRERRLFFTEMSYSSIPQLATVLAREIAAELPGHPQVQSSTSLATIKLIDPRQRVALASATHGRGVELGPGHGPRLVLFFDTGERDISNLAAGLERLNAYAALNSVAPLTAVDEAKVEPSPDALSNFLGSLPARLDYPVAIDASGRVADGYGVQNSPWLTLVSGSGRVLWQYDVGTKGWPSTAFLVKRVHAALAHAQG